MTYIPTVRNRFNRAFCGNTKGAEELDNRNAYWEGYLSDEDSGSANVCGYDYAADTVDTVFHNLEVYESVLIAAGLIKDDDDVIPIDEDVVFNDKELEDYSEETLEAMSPVTRVAKAFREIINDWLECERDSLVVGLIEGTDDNEYNRCVKKADEEGYENRVIRSYPEDLKKELQGGTDEE